MDIKLLVDIFKEEGLLLKNESEKGVVFGVLDKSYGDIFFSKAQIDSFNQFSAKKKDILLNDGCSMFMTDDYAEQLIDIFVNSRVAYMAEKVYSFKRDGCDMRVEIGTPSALYQAFAWCQKSARVYLRERYYRNYDETSSFEDFYRYVRTIKIYGIGENERRLDASSVRELFEACLFEFTYMRSVCFNLLDSWPADHRRTRLPMVRRRPFGDELRLPSASFNVDLVSFYQKGVASRDPYIQFVSFYHVLEYFFVQVSDSILYDKLTRILHDPAFRTTGRSLDKIILSVDNHRRETDETEMLKSIFMKYVDEDDVVAQMRVTEKRYGSVYTSKQTIFGQEFDKITYNANHVIGPLAKRIKAIRNALIHSSDRYERRERYIPGVQSDAVLAREIPLMRFLAESIIIATSKPIEDEI